MVVQRLSDEALAKIPNGTPLTIAVCCSDDSVLTANISYDDPDVSGVVLDSERIGHGWYINLYQGIGEARPYVRMYTDVLNETISFKWVRLLLGSYTAETLPPYVPKSYAAELAECMRYYQIVPKRIAATVSADGRAPITYAYPVVMQINPTLFKDAGDSVEVDIYGVGKKLGNITNIEVKERYCYLMLTLESEHQHKICTTTENLVLSADL